ncbi:MAG: GTPase HflX [Candidatus Desulforudis sp.]|nr:GTPase HflX [Desulforudis sp.]
MAVGRGELERAVLVGVELTEVTAEEARESLEELARLAETAGAVVVGRAWQKRTRPDPACFIGRGKAEELAALCADLGAGLLLLDQDLSPAQARNLEKLIGVKVLDRTQLILDIFAGRARTREGKLQVELAQLNYLLPRLTGLGTELSRLGGGIGTRGPGETKLETDRRRIRQRIADLQRELAEVRRQRRLLRRSRKAVPVPVIALVGYTNAGKSSLLNALTGAGVLVEDRLFATLDPTSRQLRLPTNETVVLTDTVGFIRHLPHHLVAAFRATLEEVGEADLLLHVVDAGHPAYLSHIETVDGVLAALGAGDKPHLLVLNKTDLGAPDPMETAGRETVAVSARTGAGLDHLKEAVAAALADRRVRERFFVPYARAHLVSLLHEQGLVLAEEHGADGVTLEVELPAAWARRIAARLAPNQTIS